MIPSECKYQVTANIDAGARNAGGIDMFSHQYWDGQAYFTELELGVSGVREIVQ